MEQEHPSEEQLIALAKADPEAIGMLCLEFFKRVAALRAKVESFAPLDQIEPGDAPVGGINRTRIVPRIPLPPEIQSVTIRMRSRRIRLYHQWYKRLELPPVAEEDVRLKNGHRRSNRQVERKTTDNRD